MKCCCELEAVPTSISTEAEGAAEEGSGCAGEVSRDEEGAHLDALACNWLSLASCGIVYETVAGSIGTVRAVLESNVACVVDSEAGEY